MSLELQQALADAIKQSDSLPSTHDDVDGGALQQDNNADTVAEPVQGPVAELPTEQPVRQTINVKPLNEKAVLVTHKRGRYRP